MPLTKLQVAPGIDKQNTEYGAEGKWVDSDNVRFRYGQPEKIGGWTKVTSDALLGATRAILTWSDLSSVNHAMYGTNKKLYAYSENSYADITPTRGTGSITQFATTSGSTTVTVTDADHGALVGDHVTISSVSGAIGGLTQANLQNEFEIQTATDDTYTIVAPAAASSSATGATATATYEINSGPATSIYGYGWGAGTWSRGTWDTTREGLTGAEGVLLQSTKWSLDNWGEDVLAQKFDGSIYYWDTSAGLSSNLAARTNVSNAPTKSRFMMVSGDDRHVICFGTETTIGTSSTRDDMFLRWSDQEDPAVWTPTATNTAGSQRLTDGSKLVTAKRSRGAVLVWSDTALYQMQLIGAPFVFGFQQLGSACGCIGQHAAVESNGKSFWMGNDSFFVFDGSVQKIPCSVEDYVFTDIDEASQKDTFAGLNTEFNEVTWFYCSSGSNVINRSVTYNYLENVWYVGSLARSSWFDKGVYGFPQAMEFENSSTTSTVSTITGLTAGRSFLYSHENGNNADGVALSSSITSGDFVLPEAGEKLMSIKKFIPDFKDQSGNVDVELNFKLYPSSTATTNGPYTVSPTTTKIDTRARGRQASLKITSSAIDTKWRYGTYRADVQPDGMR
jgi:hypothetical protein